MSNVTLKNAPGVTLSQILKRRKSNLTKFIVEAAITSYEGLVSTCEMIGAKPPTEAEYEVVVPRREIVTDQQNGVVVIEPTNLEHDEDAAGGNTIMGLAKKKRQRKERR